MPCRLVNISAQSLLVNPYIVEYPSTSAPYKSFDIIFRSNRQSCGCCSIFFGVLIITVTTVIITRYSRTVSFYSHHHPPPQKKIHFFCFATENCKWESRERHFNNTNFPVTFPTIRSYVAKQCRCYKH